uniref:Uncharacterized protein LOC114332491 n=1 Tax=Diabrotica virgifera virgifera TaxID=50390 RepID=A0A6P7FPH2_DIAVI
MFNLEFMYILVTLSVIFNCVLCFKLTENERRRRRVSNDSSVLDTGIGSIGIYLSNSIQHLPVQRKHYHFRIHHHYHNREKVLKYVDVFPRDITICEGTPGAFCPNGTWALCTKNGAIRCIASLWGTVPCDESFFQHCAQVTLPCTLYTPECRLERRFRKQATFNKDIPCITTLKMYSNLVYVNGTVIAQDLVKIYPPDLFCVIILALPDEATQGEELFERGSKILGELSLRVFGINK